MKDAKHHIKGHLQQKIVKRGARGISGAIVDGGRVKLCAQKHKLVQVWCT